VKIMGRKILGTILGESKLEPIRADVVRGRMAVIFAHRQVISFPTGDLSDPVRAGRAREKGIPATIYKRPTTLVLDLSGKLLSPSALTELVVTLGQSIRGGLYGDARLVVATPDQAVRKMSAYLAREYQFPLFLASSLETVSEAMPAGDLTGADFETLEGLRASGSVTTVSSLASAFGLQPSAANNRLVNVERKGYVLRVSRGRDEGDLFVDPRVPFMTSLTTSRGADSIPMRQALQDAGISSDPYSHPPREVEGDAAKRLAEILRRRGKIE
jgi:DNA-binding MarR family transcriptional regulator